MGSSVFWNTQGLSRPVQGLLYLYIYLHLYLVWYGVRVRLKCDGTRAETRFRLSPKRTSPFTWAGASVQSTAGSRGVRISGSNAGYTTFRDCVKSTGYPLHLSVSPSLPLPCLTVCNQVSNALYHRCTCFLHLLARGLLPGRGI